MLRQANLPVAACWGVLESANHWWVVAVRPDWHERTGLSSKDLAQRVGEAVFGAGKLAFGVPKLLLIENDIDIADPRQVVGVLEVGHDRALVAVDRGEVVAEGVVAVRGDGERRPGPHLVTARRLDLDHVRAQVREQHARERPGGDVGELDDPHSFQGAQRQTAAASVRVAARWASSWRTSGSRSRP